MCHNLETQTPCLDNITQFNLCTTHHGGPSDDQSEAEFALPNPKCLGMSELPTAAAERARVYKILRLRGRKPSIEPNTDEDGTLTEDDLQFESSTLFKHLTSGLAYTIGSALGTTPPPIEDCLAAYQVPNRAGLTAGARAWSKHCHRSRRQSPERESSPTSNSPTEEQNVSDKGGNTSRSKSKSKIAKMEGWWGTASGPIPVINEKSLTLFWKIMNGATWRNLHWLPHQVLVYEVRIPGGYGMRWAQDLSQSLDCVAEQPNDGKELSKRPWIFRGFLEPPMENGHELGWRHIMIMPTTT